MARYYYSATFKGFKKEANTNILGKMTQENEYALIETQRDAWTHEINMLKEALQPFQDGQIFFEYTIPRIGKRADVILLIKGIVFILEYKVGAKEYLQQYLEQAWDYALDLKNFHEESHDLSIVPILISTEAHPHPHHSFICDADQIYHPLKANSQTLRELLLAALNYIPQAPIDGYLWGISRYAPTPTIIEAARSLYNNHTVKEITRHDASAENISGTSDYLNTLIEQARSKNQKCICFVTGVPGAGKTLVGLNIATEQSNKEAGVPAVYLSGNGPLVEVLCEALTRDKVAQLKKEYALKEEKCSTKKDIYSKVKSFIQNVHHYRDTYLEGTLIQDGEIVADLAYFQT